MKNKINKLFDSYSPIRVGSLVGYQGKKYRVLFLDYPNATIADWRDESSDQQQVPINSLDFIT